MIRYAFYLVSALLLAGCQLLTPSPTALHPSTQPVSAHPPDDPGTQLLDRIGGPILAVATQDHYAFIGGPSAFAAIDVADTAHPRRVAFLPFSANDMVVAGKIAYVASRDGLRVVDIADPTKLTLLSFLALDEAPTSMAVDGDYAYVAGFRGHIAVVDVHDPQRPLLRSVTGLGIRPEGIAAVKGFLYLPAISGLFIVSVADPAQMERVSHIDFGDWVQDVTIVGDRAYVSSAEGLGILDITDAAHPVRLGFVRLGGLTDDVRVAGRYAFVANGTAGVKVIDIADAQAPKVIATLSLPGSVQRLAHAGAHVFANGSDGDLQILDAHMPAQLASVGVYRAPGPAWHVVAADEFLYAVADYGGDLYILDRNNPAHLRQVGYFRTDGTSLALAVHDHIAYAGDTEGGVHILDVTTPAQVKELSFLQTDAGVDQITIAGDVILLSLHEGSTLAFDMSDPRHPHLLATCNAPGQSYAIAASMTQPRLLAVAADGQISDARTDCLAPVAARLPAATATSVPADQYAYLPGAANTVQVVDISSADQPRQANEILLPSQALDVALDHDIALIALGQDGVHILDLSDPLQPIAIGSLAVTSSARSITTAAGIIYIADQFGGIAAFRYRPAP